MISITLTIMLTFALWAMFDQASDISTGASTRVEIYQSARLILNTIEQQVCAAVADETKSRFLYINDDELSPPHAQGSAASGGNFDVDDPRFGQGYLVVSGLTEAWEINALQGLFVKLLQSGQVRYITGNSESMLTTSPRWDPMPRPNEKCVISRNADKMVFWTTAPNMGAFDAARVAFFLEIPDGVGDNIDYHKIRLKMVRRTTAWDADRYRDLTSEADLGVGVVDFNIEYFDDTLYTDGPFDGYRQADDNHPDWVQPPANETDPWLRGVAWRKFTDASQNFGGRAYLPSALRITIRVTDRRGRVERSFSQEMGIHRATRKPRDTARNGG